MEQWATLSNEVRQIIFICLITMMFGSWLMMKTMDKLDEKEQKIPDLKFPVTINLPSEILNEAVEDVDVVGESVTFMAEPKKFTINAEGDLSQAKIEVKESDSVKIKVESNETVKAKYSIEYLKKMITGSKIADEVSIYFNKDYPLKLEYKTVDKVMLSFILAPRVENE